MSDYYHRRDDGLFVDLWYPRCPDRPKFVELGLVDVRAADPLRIEYDFDRDGWVVKQASRFTFEADDEKQDQDWQEVAFIRAWAREQT